MKNIQSKVESLLFISNKPLTCKQIAKILNIEENEVKKVLESLIKKFNTKESGIHISKIQSAQAEKFSFVSNPDNYEVLKEFVKSEINTDLTRPALETLTIIAYLGPITKVMIEKLRGVNCSLILKNLLLRGLIEEEQKESDLYYSVSQDFMNLLGITDIKALPDYEELKNNNVLKQLV